jgi:lysophospholipase L1-like esterase
VIAVRIPAVVRARRWQAAGLALLSVLVLACEGTGQAGPDAADRPPPGLPSSMAALGDSITAGYGSCTALVVCRRNSWSTGNGTRVDSHYRRIRADNPKITDNGRNYAMPGARAQALLGQADSAVRAKVRYVTVLIGANDACRTRVDDMTSTASFRAYIDAGLRRLKDGLPDARVLVVSIPDVHRLWEVGHDNPAAVRAWNRGVCPSLLANPTSTAAEDERRRQRVDDRIDAYNRELSEACSAYGEHCRYDGGSAHRVRFTLDLVNKFDYFHPNAAGQERLADTTWPRRFTW